MVDIVNGILINFLHKVTNFAPNFFGGLIILLIGFVLSAIVKRILLSLFSFFRLNTFLSRMKLMQKEEVTIWQEVFSEILRWTIIVLFLIPTLEVWELSRATIVLNQLLFYLPNVIVAVVIGFIGLVLSNLAADVVAHSMKTLGGAWAKAFTVLTKWAILFFTLLIVLNQLGVAQDLIRIFFTGIVAMLALAGGLAFGLGGQESARELLEEIKKKLK